MIKLNKYDTNIKSLNKGAIIKFEEVISNETENDTGEFINDFIIGTMIEGNHKTPVKLWMWHFLNECETEDGNEIQSWMKEKSDDPNTLIIPDSIEIIGLSDNKEKVVIKPLSINN